MSFFSNWWFWIIVLGIIALIVGAIIMFATSLSVWIAWVLFGAGAFLIILGIVFWILNARKPKQNQMSRTTRFIRNTPGLAEASFFEEKSGLADSRRRLQAKAGSDVSAGYRKTKQIINDPRFKGSGKGLAVGGLVGVGTTALLAPSIVGAPFTVPLAVGIAGGTTAGGYYTGSRKIKGQQKLELRQQELEQQKAQQQALYNAQLEYYRQPNQGQQGQGQQSQGQIQYQQQQLPVY